MTYYASDDEERWTGNGPYGTRETAIAAAPIEFDLKPGQKFWTGAENATVDTFGPYADRVIEEAQERALDDNDYTEDWLNSVTEEQRGELDKALEDVWEAWLDKHGLRPKWFNVESIQEHTYDGSDLHVFYNDHDYVVARSVEDAWEVWEQSCGEKREDYEPEWEWEQKSDDGTLTINDEDAGPQTKTRGEWARSNGRGFLCSTEF